MDVYDVLNCQEHGWRAHAAYHEVGHASVGMSRGAPIIRVTLGIGGFGNSGTTSGGLTHLDEEQFLSWYRQDPAASLAFSVAGALSEEQFLGHFVGGGMGEDLMNWRKCNGLLDGDVMANAEAAMGRTFESVVEDTRSWLKSHHTAVNALAARLGEVGELTPTDLDAVLGEASAS